MITALAILADACESVSSNINWKALSDAMVLFAQAIAEAKEGN